MRMCLTINTAIIILKHKKVIRYILSMNGSEEKKRPDEAHRHLHEKEMDKMR